MSDLSSRISEFTAYFESGAENSASTILSEILHEFLRSLYPISPPERPVPRYLVHYTGLDALFSMLDHDNPGYLRLYDTIHSNDPTEGVFFRDHLKQSCPSVHDLLPSFVLNPNPRYAYISSFIRADDEEKERDKLVYWLAYGRNGYGCSIAIPYSDFSPGLPILPIQYGESAVTKTAERLVSFFNSFPSSIQQQLFVPPSSSTSGLSSLFNSFHSIPYFHKPDSYSYEAECRLFLSPVDRLCNPTYQPRYTAGGTPTVRHYVEHDPLHLAGIFFTGTVITLGPSIPRPDNVKRAIYALLHHHRLMGPRVFCSAIPYTPSSI